MIIDIKLVSESKFKKRKKGPVKAKAKKGGSGNLRSIMLKAIMPQFSGKRGDRLALAIKAMDDSTVKQLMDGVTASVVKSIQKKKEAMGITANKGKVPKGVVEE